MKCAIIPHLICVSAMVLRLLDQQLQAWRVSVQSEQSILEKRCAGMEGTLEALRRETRWLEGVLTQVTSH